MTSFQMNFSIIREMIFDTPIKIRIRSPLLASRQDYMEYELIYLYISILIRICSIGTWEIPHYYVPTLCDLFGCQPFLTKYRHFNIKYNSNIFYLNKHLRTILGHCQSAGSKVLQSYQDQPSSLFSTFFNVLKGH